MENKVPTLAFDLERDLRALSAMASNLTPYLYETEIYGYLSGDLPRLTLGGLLMRLYRLSRLDKFLNERQEDTLQTARRSFEAARNEWRVHYENKLQRELQVRLDALDQFIGECADDLQSCIAGYPMQAEKRIMIKHLADEAKSRNSLSDSLVGRLSYVDNRLRRIFKDGPFIFSDDRLKSVYPPDDFWWLYGTIDERT